MTSSRYKALQHFKRVDSHFYQTTRAQHAELPAEIETRTTRVQLFESLIKTVVSQQLATGAAAAIFARIKAECGKIIPSSVLNTPTEKLRAAGLSGSKVKTLQAVATAVQTRQIDLLALKKMPEADAAAKLQEIWGIGPWSAEMFLMFSVGNADVFSAGDLGLVRAIEAIYKLPKNTPRAELDKIAAVWSPHRTMASLLLWRYRDSAKD